MRSVVAILGPTATGKSALALQLAEELGGEIVNGDALQVYRGFDIGTSKPSAEDRARIRHHLVDILDPRQRYSAGEFSRRARLALEEIDDRGRIALVVGGSGFHLRALFDGLSPIPKVPDDVRSEVRRELDEKGLEAVRAELRRVDPTTERRLADGDRQRVSRALEVWRATSRPLSYWIEERPKSDGVPAIKLGLTLPRGLLYDRIAARAREMIDGGWIDEVRGLLASGLTGSEPAFQAIGYREVVEHVRHDTPLTKVLEEIVVSTRRYAKRQVTWFRREPDVAWYPAEERERLPRAVLTDLEDKLRTAEEK